MKKILLAWVMGILIASHVMATGRFFVPVYIDHYHYGQLTATLPELFLTIYDQDDDILYEETFLNVEMEKGRTTLQISDEDQVKLSEDARKVGILVPEFEEEYIFNIQEVPFSRHAFKAQHMDWEGISNKPSLTELEGNLDASRVTGLQEQLDQATFTGVIKANDIKSRLLIENEREQNNTYAGIELLHDGKGSEAYLKLNKNNFGKNQLMMGTETNDDVMILTDNEPRIKISDDGIETYVPIKGDGSELTDISIDHVSGLTSQLESLSTTMEELESNLEVDTDQQELTLIGDTLSIERGNSVDLNKYLDNTDNQTLTLSGDRLEISGGNSVDLSGYKSSIESELAFGGSNARTSGATKVAVYDEFDNSDSDTVQDVLDDLDDAIETLKSATVDEAEIDGYVANNGYLTATSSLNGDKVTQATTSQRGTVQLSSATDSSSETTAATSKAVHDVKTSLGNLAYKNNDDEEVQFLNTVRVKDLIYETIKQKENQDIVLYDPKNSSNIGHSGVAMFASGFVEIRKGVNEVTVTVPFKWIGGVINVYCNGDPNTFMHDGTYSHTFVSTYHALTHREWDKHTVVQKIGDDTSFVISKDHDQWCNISDADETSFTLNGNETYSFYASWWITAPSQ